MDHNHPHAGKHPHDHNLTHSHNHDYRRLERRRLILSIVITGGMFFVEAVGGVLSNSLALLSDAGHMFTHVIALGISLLAIRFASQEPTDRMTFGFYRAEIMAAFFNGITLFLLTLWIGYEAWERFFTPRSVNSIQMFWIALLGLAVNVATAAILRDASREDMNVRSAFLHMLGDTLSSVGVILGAGAIYFFGWTMVDPVLSIVLCIPIVLWSVRLVRESVDVLLEAAPPGIDMESLRSAVVAVEGVEDIHDIHLWSLTSGRHALSAHLTVKDRFVSETGELLLELNERLKNDFMIEHTTFQIECGGRCIAACR